MAKKELKYIEVERIEQKPKPKKKGKRTGRPKDKRKKLTPEEKAKMAFWDSVPMMELNPNAEKDFDIVLSGLLQPINPNKKVIKKKRRARRKS